jgi:hypothetical protein
MFVSMVMDEEIRRVTEGQESSIPETVVYAYGIIVWEMNNRTS